MIDPLKNALNNFSRLIETIILKKSFWEKSKHRREKRERRKSVNSTCTPLGPIWNPGLFISRRVLAKEQQNLYFMYHELGIESNKSLTNYLHLKWVPNYFPIILEVASELLLVFSYFGFPNWILGLIIWRTCSSILKVRRRKYFKSSPLPEKNQHNKTGAACLWYYCTTGMLPIQSSTYI